MGSTELRQSAVGKPHPVNKSIINHRSFLPSKEGAKEVRFLIVERQNCRRPLVALLLCVIKPALCVVLNIFFCGILYNRICSGNLFVLIWDSGVHKNVSRKTLSPCLQHKFL